MATIGLGVTVGSYSLRAVKLRRKGTGYIVQKVFADRLNDETRAVAGRALAARGVRGTAATVGLTGRDVIIRYSQVPPVPEWRLRNLMKFEVDEVGSQSGGDVSADYRKLNLPDPEGERTDDTILVALARNHYIDRLISACDAGGVKVGATCPNSVALFNAFAVNATYTEDETSLLVNIGAEDLDLAIQRGGELLFARNAMPGGSAFTDAIQQAFNTSPGKADQMKIAKADVTPRGQARYPDSTSEKVANAIMGVAGQLSSLIQSTLMIARAQAKLPDLKVDRVLLAGGGASLKGLDLYLKQAMGVPVERLDPFAISDLSGLPDDERELAESAPHEFAVAVGLAQSRLDPLAFGLEVLPTALRRRRDFLTKGIYAAGAAVLAIGILVLIYQGRSQAAEDGRRALSRLKSKRSQAESQDGKFREILYTQQELGVKHVLLGDIMAPGALLASAWNVLEGSLGEMQDVYLHTVQLKVDESSYEFPYFKERRREKATGYEETKRRYGFRRSPTVHVEGRIAGGQVAAGVYAKFVESCQAKAKALGLVVDTGRRLTGGGVRDAKFELVFHPGVEIKTKTEEGQDSVSVVLRNLDLDDHEEPAFLRGRRADGVRVQIPIEQIRQIGGRRAKDVVKEMQDEAAANAPVDEDEE
jgi:type IV pilus assembly protein PilM